MRWLDRGGNAGMELRHLRYFIAVAEELNFRRASERLHVSQPPLSQQIKQLEAEVKVQLLERTKRWVRLTSAGRLFLEHARQVLAQVDSAVLAARQTIGGEGDRLSAASESHSNGAALPQGGEPQRPPHDRGKAMEAAQATDLRVSEASWRDLRRP